MKNLTFSKWLALIITSLFIATVIAGIVLECFGHDISTYVNIVLISETVVLGGYFGKAGFENITKIKNNEGSEM